MSPSSETLQTFKCEEPGCKKSSFSSKANLQRHIKSVHGHKAQMPCGEMRANHASNNKRHARNCGNCRALNTGRHSAACDVEGRQDKNHGSDENQSVQQGLGTLYQNDFNVPGVYGETGNQSNFTFHRLDAYSFNQNMGHQFYDQSQDTAAVDFSAYGATYGQGNPSMGADLNAHGVFWGNAHFDGQGR